jgi:type III pantothenate kinase
VWLLQLMAIEGIERAAEPHHRLTVVPRAANFRVLASKYFGVDLLVAGEGEAAYGIVVDVVEPKSLGADRAVNAIAAHAKYPGDLIVVDFGTATTIDHIDAAAPTGAGSSRRASTFARCAGGGHGQAAAYRHYRARNRQRDRPHHRSQMQIGIYWGYVAMMEG